MRHGDFCIVFASRDVIVFQRELEGQVVLIALNAGWGEVNVTPWAGHQQHYLKELLVPAGVHLLPGQTITMTGRSFRIWTESGASFLDL